MQPNNEAEIARREAGKILETASKLTIKSGGDLEAANQLLQIVTNTSNNVVTRKEAALRPLKTEIKQLRNAYRQPEKALAQAKKVLEQKIKEYTAK